MSQARKPSFHFLAIRHYHVLSQRDWQPALNIYETEHAMLLVIELAGIDIETLHIEAESNLVRIQGVRPSLPVHELRRIHRMEISAGAFQIEVPLTVAIDPDHARSRYHNGLLEITLPLLKQQARRVSINVEEEGTDDYSR